MATISIVNQTMSSILDPDQSFASLSESVGLDVRLRKAVARMGHVRPTLVQSKCLPLVLSSGRDLLVRARTGSGKTLAYSLPVLQKLLHRPKSGASSVGAIIMVPTRELCFQVQKTLQQLMYYCDDVLSSAVLSVGSASGSKNSEELERQEAALRDKPDVLVATPNALLTHIRRSKESNAALLDLRSSVETLVIDEADLVLSFGYRDDLSEIIKSIPRIYQGILLSATLTPELDSLKTIVLHSPVTLKLEDEKEHAASTGHLKQFFVALPSKDKNLVLYVFLKLGLLKGKGLFFVNTTDAGYRLKLFLEQFHIRSAVLNAELPFRSRLNIIEQFNIGNFDYLIATDSSTDAGKSAHESDDDNDDSDDSDGDIQAPQTVAKSKRKTDSAYGVSRGLDFRHVAFVLNVDLPPNTRSYAHRIGRTARGGAKGVALSLVDSNSKEQLQTLLEIQESQPRIPLTGASTENLQAVPTGIDDNTSGLEEQLQPVPLDFDLREIEGFRYRVEDVSRAVTRTAVKETRAAELKAEILNSERLQAHFEDHPADLQILAHDRVATHVSKVQDHLKHVPKYLLPQGMQVANLNRRRKKKVNKRGRIGERRSDNDPLQNFDGEVDLDGIQGDEDADNGADSSAKKAKLDAPVERRVFTSTKDGTGQSSSGRTAWKEKHRKGKFSRKKRLAERKHKQPLGI
jgi:ATP-dependent RNA helicase DDX56/DBP9